MGNDRWDAEYPRQLRRDEGKLLKRGKKEQPSSPTGVAISGGGIRSATFALGIFQAFAKKDHLPRFDYLSTVSGGGYLGGFYGSLFTRPESKFEDVRKALEDDSPQLKYLRRNGRFLAPAGGRDLLLAGAVLFRNWVAVFLVIACLALGLGLLLEVLPMVIGAWANSQISAGMEALHQRAALSESAWFIDSITLSSLSQGLEQLAQALSWPDILGWGESRQVWLSEWLWIGGCLVVLAAAPLGWSYFLVGSSKSPTMSWFPWFERRTTIKPLMLAVNGVLIGLGLQLLEDRPTLSLALFYLSVFTMTQTIGADYWLAIRGRKIEDARFSMGEGVISLGLGFVVSALALFSALCLGRAQPVAGGIAFFVTLLLGRAILSKVSPKEVKNVDRDLFSRHMVSVWLKRWLVGAGFVLALGLIQTGGRTLYLLISQDIEWFAGILGAAVTALSGYARTWLVGLKTEAKKEQRSSNWMASLPAILGTLLALALAITASALAAKIIYPEPPLDQSADALLKIPTDEVNVTQVIWSLLLFLGLSLGFGFSRRFLNNSTHLPLYAARITRAYLGATNSLRVPLGEQNHAPAVSAKLAANRASATHLMPDDDISLKEYFRSAGSNSPYMKGAPLHLINVTINETVDGRSGDHNPDAKGLGLAIGPCGMSAGVKHHRLFSWDNPEQVTVFPKQASFRVFEPVPPWGPFRPEPEQISLGRWLGISGAAFSTGIGLRTNFGTSFLAGITNIRLGHWWFACVKRDFSLTRFFGPIFWVQQYLFRELGARFPGTANTLWYLSDGGHFENMGAYELIRRRVKTIVILDGEADPHYEFEGLAHLVRKSRIDFGAEIEFLGRDHPHFAKMIAPELHKQFGTLDEMRRGNWERDVRLISDPPGPATLREHGFKLQDSAQKELSQVSAAVARVTYSDKSEGILIYVKPTLTGKESTDVTRYHTDHPSFPHESTGDQFFDEAQWESYRKLGFDIGERLFETWPVRDISPS